MSLSVRSSKTLIYKAQCVSYQPIKRSYHSKPTRKLSPLKPDMSGPGNTPSATTVLRKTVSKERNRELLALTRERTRPVTG